MKFTSLLLILFVTPSTIPKVKAFQNIFHSSVKKKLVKTSQQQVQFLVSAKIKADETASGKGFGVTKEKEINNNDIDRSNISGICNEDNQERVDEKIVNEMNEDSDLSDDELIRNTKMFKKSRAVTEQLLQEKIKLLREEEELMATDPSVGAVPELVADRMIKRIILFFGIPVFGGLAIFVSAFFASKKYDLVVPPTIIAYATQVPFVIGLVGISYAIISTSWDEEEGSALGIKEFQLNFSRIQEGLTRTRDKERLKSEIEKDRESLGRR